MGKAGIEERLFTECDRTPGLLIAEDIGVLKINCPKSPKSLASIKARLLSCVYRERNQKQT